MSFIYLQKRDFSFLIGKTLTLAEPKSLVMQSGGIDKMMRKDCADPTAIHFQDSEDNDYVLGHEQDCCETVTLEDMCGDLQDLIGAPILVAEHRTGDAEILYENKHGEGYDTCAEYNFYELGTIKGSVTIRYHGQSNGYYSMRANLYEIVTEED